MLIVYHQYDLSSISDFRLDNLATGGSGAVSDSVTKEPKPSTATIENGHGNGKLNLGGATLKTADHPMTSVASTDSPKTTVASTDSPKTSVASTNSPKTSAASTDSKGSLATTNAGLDPTRVALLLETRPLPHLPALLSHFISVLPAPWVFRFVGSSEANSLISSSKSLSAHIKTGKLVITELPKKYAITSQETISMTLTDPTFYKDFLAPAEWLLMFQSDSMICAASERNIEEWISAKYSWVGAPWNMDVKGGNGGLSLRHVPPIMKVLEKEVRKEGEPWEDRWICDRLLKLEGAKMPGPDIEATFSVESQWHDKPFGYHLMGSGKNLVPGIWDNKELKDRILQYCPEIKIVLDMDLVRETQKLTKELEKLKSPKVDAEKEKETAKKEKGT
ncbi:hypothetical protein NHQ30_009146 [Ciborinia camelliae]|nr:hypothetical protein NHQ30_009146 [Ciborinia camelliae]